MPLIVWLLAFFFDACREEKYEKDFFFAYRAWAEGRMTDKQFRRYGDMARRYIQERDERQTFYQPRQEPHFEIKRPEPSFFDTPQPVYAAPLLTLRLLPPTLRIEHAQTPPALGFRSRSFN